MGILSSSKSKRGFYVLTSIVFIVLIVVLISMIRNMNVFSNEKLNGKYSGTINFQDKSPYMLNLTFDGKGRINGTMQMDNSTLNFNDMEYFCMDNHVEFSIFFYNDTSSQHFVFMGDTNEAGTLISGTVQISEGSEIIQEATFYLSLIE